MDRICTTLAENGMDITLVGRKIKPVTLEKKAYKTELLTCFFNKNIFFYIEYNLRLFFYLLFHSFDIVCGVDLDTLPAAWLSARVKRKKCYYDAHEYFPEVIEVQGRKRVKYVWEQIQHFLLPKVDLVYTVSQSIANTFTDLYHRKVYIVRNLPLIYTIKETKTEYGLIYQGDLNEGRGLEPLILAMKNINSNLIIIGDGYLKNHLETLVKSNKLENKIHFTGYIESDKLKIYTEKSLIGISFLENKGRSYYYSLSNKFFDYIMAGIPQIGSAFPEYQLINKEYNIAILIDDIQPKTIEENINKLLNNKVLYEEIKANCIIARNHFSWDKELQILIKLYQNG